MGLMDIRRRILADAPQLATATGAVASFTTDMAVPLKKCEFSIEPVQSGSGDPSPINVRPISGWTGCNMVRCGINIWDEEWEHGIYNTATGAKSDASSAMTRLRAKNHIPCYPDTQYYVSSAVSVRIFLFYDKDGNYLSYKNIYFAGNPFTTPADAYYMTFYSEEEVETYQNNISINYPSTDTSYHAYTGTTIPVEFPAQGKNLLPSFVESTTKDGVTFTVAADGSVTVNGTATATTSYKSPSSTWKWDGTENCWLSGCPQGGSYSGGYSLRVDAFNGGGYSDPDVGSGCLLSAAIGNIANTSLCYCIVVRSGTVCNNIVFKPQLQTGSTATSYEPYTNTVYGGTVDVVTGVLRVTWAAADMGDLSWTGVSDYFRASALPAKAIGVTNIICTCYPTSNSVSATQMANKSIKGYDANNYIYAKDTDYETGTAFGTAVTGQKIVYELATPVTYQLTPQQITALKGQNNVWCDTGNTTVQYWKH